MTEYYRGKMMHGGVFQVEETPSRTTIIKRGAFMTGQPPRPGATTDDDDDTPATKTAPAPTLDDIKKMIELTRQKVEALAAQVRRR